MTTMHVAVCDVRYRRGSFYIETILFFLVEKRCFRLLDVGKIISAGIERGIMSCRVIK